MAERLLDWAEFDALAAELLGRGSRLRFRARGTSMHPFIQDGDLVTVEAAAAGTPRRGDIVLARLASGRLVVHRVRQVGPDSLLVQGDAVPAPDGRLGLASVLGRVTAVERAGRPVRFERGLQRVLAGAWLALAPARRRLLKVRRAVGLMLRGQRGRS